MMVANSSNLIITVKPANQRAVLGPSSTLGPTPVPAPRRASMSSGGHSHHSHPSSGEDPDDRHEYN